MEFNIVVVGGGGVGKSAMTIQLVQNNFVEEYDPTIEDSYRKNATIDGKAASLNILDTAGQDEYAAMRESYMVFFWPLFLSPSSFSPIFPTFFFFFLKYLLTLTPPFPQVGGDGFLIVYSVTSRNSFAEVNDFYDQILRVKDVEKFPAVVAGNKCDVGDRFRKVMKREGEDLCEGMGVPFFETSAKIPVNVEEAFFEIVREIKSDGKKKGKEGRKRQCAIL